MCSYFKLQLKTDMYVMYWLLILKISDFVDFVNIYNQVMIVNFNSDWDLINQSDYIQEHILTQFVRRVIYGGQLSSSPRVIFLTSIPHIWSAVCPHSCFLMDLSLAADWSRKWWQMKDVPAQNAFSSFPFFGINSTIQPIIDEEYQILNCCKFVLFSYSKCWPY